jgi:hypothetical protein|tara:strand:+ start:969 stop:1271 length:303 start_codon:yes stop_codon:yes gene_type:complete
LSGSKPEADKVQAIFYVLYSVMIGGADMRDEMCSISLFFPFQRVKTRRSKHRESDLENETKSLALAIQSFSGKKIKFSLQKTRKSSLAGRVVLLDFDEKF